MVTSRPAQAPASSATIDHVDECWPAGPVSPASATTMSRRLRIRWRPDSGVDEAPKQRHGSAPPRVSTTATPEVSTTSSAVAAAKPASRVGGTASSTTTITSAAVTATATGRARSPRTGSIEAREVAKARRACPPRSLLAAETRKTTASRP